jgi:hypothetical protein
VVRSNSGCGATAVAARHWGGVLQSRNGFGSAATVRTTPPRPQAAAERPLHQFSRKFNCQPNQSCVFIAAQLGRITSVPSSKSIHAAQRVV